ncbi:15590_t:CDS:2, partial [Gigaspora rosea]
NGSTDSLNLEQVQSDISPEINPNNTPKQVENISNDASNPDICQESKNQCFTSPIYMKPKSLEDKAVDDFLDLQNKEIVSNMMRERNREKKFQDQESIQRISTESEQVSIDQTHNAISPEIKIPYDQKENLTIQEINVQIPDLPLKKILIGSDEVTAQIIVDLFNTAMKTRQKENLCWYCSTKADVNLRKRSFKAKKVYTLFEGIGIDKIRQITYSANAISSLKDDQIQNIINHFPKKQTNPDDKNNCQKRLA